MDEGKSNYSYNRTDIEPVNKSILESRAQRKLDSKELTADLKQLKSETEAMIAVYKRLPELTKAQEKAMGDLDAQVQALKKTISEATNGQADYSKAIDLASESAKTLLKNKKRIYDLDVINAETEKDKAILAQKLNIETERYGDLIEKNTVRTERNKKANESLLDGFHQSLKGVKQDFKDLAEVTGLDNIYKTLTGNGGQLQTYNTMRSQFNMTKSDFNQFKREIFTQVKENGNLFKYGFQDALDYMNRLGELGITDQQMAKEQMDAIMLSTKYLGLSAETQTKILKQARNTGNMDLLNQTNRTMVQIMNAQLGVSKDQLDAIVNQSTELSDLATMFSGNPNALKSFSMSASAIQSVYGESASKAAMDIAADLLNSGGSSKYVGVLGDNYGDIVKGLQAGDGRALYDILSAVQRSNVSGTGAGGAESWAALNRGGLLDRNTLALYNARGNGKDTYGTALERIASSSDDTQKYLNDMQEDFRTMFTNLTSWINAFFPLQSLQTTYYTLAIADLVFKGGKATASILKAIKTSIIPALMSTKASTSGALKLLGGTGIGGSTGITAYLGNIVGGLSLVAGAVWAVKDGVDGISKAEEWGTSKGAAFLGGMIGGTNDDAMINTIKNALKWGLIGAGIGTLVGGPGIGTIVGGVIGAFGGGVTGTIGGKNFAEMFDSMGSASSAPVTNLSNSRGSYTGRGGILPSSDFPWSITSPFGYRGTIQTKAGNTDPFHNGIDLAHPDGTPIGANNSGIVSASGTASDGANYVIINSGDGYEQVYWHLNQPSHLKAGQSVNAGQLIGYMGMTGMATGPHLHFGLRHAGTRDYIDPINSINSELFYPNETGVSNLGVWLPGMALEDDKPTSSTMLKKLIDADTTSREVQALAYDGIGSTNIVDSVNGGFSSLIQKIDDLSNRQNKQEEMLKVLASSKGTNIYKY